MWQRQEIQKMLRCIIHGDNNLPIKLSELIDEMEMQMDEYKKIRQPTTTWMSNMNVECKMPEHNQIEVCNNNRSGSGNRHHYGHNRRRE